MSIDINNLNGQKLLRIKFEKTGLAKYISHLDLNRVFARSLARAKTKIIHSEGFNPRPKIVFASAISLGTESFCEFADIKIKSIHASGIINSAADIKKFFPTGINIIEIYEPQRNFKDIDRTKFEIYIKNSEIKEIEKMLSEDVFAEKKPGIIINLKDYITDLKYLDEENQEYKIISAVLKTNQSIYLNPENIVKAINLKYNIEDYFIRKIEIYDKDGIVFA
ncbi:MAG: TIGR03936 family radical SAM-associated protein [Oscillospiraceae bacterium]|nr:TIGR03936 family radical SAM-associated protein [Oscillospiraceae bacterium]